MKKICVIISIVAIMLSFATISNADAPEYMSIEHPVLEIPEGVKRPAHLSPRYQLVFDDEFNGTSLDTTKWNYFYPWSRTHNHGGYAMPQNVIVRDGILTLLGENVKQPGTTGAWIDGVWVPHDYTTGVINSKNKEHFTYGYFEGSFKMAAGKGMWPAWWMLEEGWPPEIDIFEFLGSEETIMHYNYHYGRDWENRKTYTQTIDLGSKLAEEFHVYGYDWQPNKMAWYYDGKMLGSEFTRSDGIRESDNMYMILNLAINGWDGLPDETTPWPAYYQCDWIRVWQMEETQGIVPGNVEPVNDVTLRETFEEYSVGEITEANNATASKNVKVMYIQEKQPISIAEEDGNKFLRISKSAKSMINTVPSWKHTSYAMPIRPVVDPLTKKGEVSFKLRTIGSNNSPGDDGNQNVEDPFFVGLFNYTNDLKDNRPYSAPNLQMSARSLFCITNEGGKDSIVPYYMNAVDVDGYRNFYSADISDSTGTDTNALCSDFSLDTWHDIKIELDLNTDIWLLYCDGKLINKGEGIDEKYSKLELGGHRLENLAIGFFASKSLDSVKIDIDDIVMKGVSLPESDLVINSVNFTYLSDYVSADITRLLDEDYGSVAQIGADISVINTGAEGRNITAIFAVFDDGKLAKVATKSFELTHNNVERLLNISIESEFNENSTLKFMIFDTDNTLEPLIHSVTIDENGITY